jgi:hypothetical protein
MLPLAKLERSLERRDVLLNSTLRVLGQWMQVSPPEEDHALRESIISACGEGGAAQLLLISAGGHCAAQLVAKGETALANNDYALAVSLFNRARMLNQDAVAVYDLLKTALSRELNVGGGSWPRPGGGDYFSQVGQDMWLARHVFPSSRGGGGVFVEAGAADGVTGSNTLWLERERGWTGVCVEPHPDTFQQLRRLRPACIAVHAAVRGPVCQWQRPCSASAAAHACEWLGRIDNRPPLSLRQPYLTPSFSPPLSPTHSSPPVYSPPRRPFRRQGPRVRAKFDIVHINN